MKQSPRSYTPLALPPEFSRAPVRLLVKPIARFLQIQSASGVLLVLCTAVALALANSRWSSDWQAFWHTEFGIMLGTWELKASLTHWINDGLMTVFFFVVGLEIKREMVDGELSSLKQAALPIVAALGGMIVPAGIYLLMQYGQAGQHGWGIPMATDIAFAVGILALLGRRVPSSLKIFLLALAIADDIGAILVIALFYSGDVHFTSLALAGAGVIVVVLLNRIAVRSIEVYSAMGIAIWLAMHNSGIHPAIAGVVLGLFTPAREWISRDSFVNFMQEAVDRLDGQIDRPKILGNLAMTARETVSPLERLEYSLHGWVAFAIMPVFALANAGVVLHPQAANNGVTWAVAAGLIVGKPLGIVLFSWLTVRMGLSSLPSNTNWLAILGAGCLGGVGFTMSLFIAGLGFDGTLLDAAKIGTLAGSTLSAIFGFVLLYFCLHRSESEFDPEIAIDSSSDSSMSIGV